MSAMINFIKAMFQLNAQNNAALQLSCQDDRAKVAYEFTLKIAFSLNLINCDVKFTYGCYSAGTS